MAVHVFPAGFDSEKQQSRLLEKLDIQILNEIKLKETLVFFLEFLNILIKLNLNNKERTVILLRELQDTKPSFQRFIDQLEDNYFDNGDTPFFNLWTEAASSFEVVNIINKAIDLIVDGHFIFGIILMELAPEMKMLKNPNRDILEAISSLKGLTYNAINVTSLEGQLGVYKWRLSKEIHQLEATQKNSSRIEQLKENWEPSES